MPFRGRVRRRRRWRRRLVFAGLASAAYAVRNKKMAANDQAATSSDPGSLSS